jgi:hypothetical protein
VVLQARALARSACATPNNDMAWWSAPRSKAEARCLLFCLC